MNIILKKIWDFLKQKNRWLIVLVILIILGQYGIIRLKNNKIADLNDKYTTEVKLKDALLDSAKYYKNKRDEAVAEKLTIQETVKNLEKMYGQLTENQKELVQRIKELGNKNEVIAAALIKTDVKIDSLLAKDKQNGNVVTVDTTKKLVNINNLASKDTSFVYDIDVNNVLPAFLTIKPYFLFKSIEIPNKQFAEFHWKNDKKKGYPISFSISNSNKYIKVTGLESYAIPPLDKLKLNPTGWQKIGNFFVKNGKTVLYIGIGGLGGAAAYHYFVK
ncbi:MAG: hypothetical protein WC428_00220 [Candidatus Paceibacterota bacterium]|jgi:hypothetical protein